MAETFAAHYSTASEAGLAALMAKLEERDNLSNEEKTALEEGASGSKAYAAGADIVREGQRPLESTLLITGFSARYNNLEDGRRQITSVHVPGDFIDLHSFPLHTMDHSIVALTDCTVKTFPHERLRLITEQHPHLTRLLWLSTLIDGSIHRRWLVAMGRLSSPAQLAHLFCELAMRLSVVGLAKDHAFKLPLTQEQLADVLGLSGVHVNRVVQDLRRRQLISWASRRLAILDWDGLSALAEFNPDYLHLQREHR